MSENQHPTEPDMFDHEDSDDAFVERVAGVLRTAEPASPSLTERVMRAVRGTGVFPASSRGWWLRRRTIQVSPIGALAAAAAIAALGILGTLTVRGGGLPPGRIIAGTANAPGDGAHTDTVHVVRFVFMAPAASTVSLVGDFNNWERGATMLRRAGAPGLWTVSVPLPRGAHQYAFVIDGTTWTPDPATSTTVTDDFGTTTSVITVGGAG